MSVYLDLYKAAALLGTTRDALRKCLARGSKRRGDDIICDLGDGVFAIKPKSCKRWRVRFPEQVLKDSAVRTSE